MSWTHLRDESPVARKVYRCRLCATEDWSAGIGPKPRKIVLTVAHVLNPDPMDCRDENLAALCQRCHLRHDAKQHAVNARATRDAKKGQGTLMEVGG